MDEIDVFASSLLEESKRFLELAKEFDGDDGQTAFLHAALMIGFCAFEAHINAIGDEMALGPNLSAHDIGILKELDVQLKNGRFEVVEKLKMYRLEDRVAFLFARFSEPANRLEPWWSRFRAANTLRNELTHPKEVPSINVSRVQDAIEALIETTDRIYKAVYKKRLPAAVRGLHSSLDF